LKHEGNCPNFAVFVNFVVQDVPMVDALPDA